MGATLDILKDHPLLKSVCSCMKLTIDKSRVGDTLADRGEVIDRVKIPLKPSTAYKLSSCESYNLLVLNKLVNILDTFERLELIQVFVDNFDYSLLHNKDVPVRMWLDYHFQFYLVSVCSLDDLALLTINNILKLGIKDNNCRRESVIENSWVSEPVKDAYKRISGCIECFKKLRNTFIHHGENPMENQETRRLIGSDDFSLIMLALEGMEDINKLDDSNIYDMFFSIEAGKLLVHIKETTGKLADLFIKLFDELCPVYKAISGLLENSALLVLASRSL